MANSGFQNWSWVEISNWMAELGWDCRRRSVMAQTRLRIFEGTGDRESVKIDNRKWRANSAPRLRLRIFVFLFSTYDFPFSFREAELAERGDLNPRYRFTLYDSLANCWFKPLTHLSSGILARITAFRCKTATPRIQRSRIASSSRKTTCQSYRSLPIKTHGLPSI